MRWCWFGGDRTAWQCRVLLAVEMSSIENARQITDGLGAESAYVEYAIHCSRCCLWFAGGYCRVHTTAVRFWACIDEWRWRDCPQVGFELATLIGLKPMMSRFTNSNLSCAFLSCPSSCYLKNGQHFWTSHIQLVHRLIQYRWHAGPHHCTWPVCSKDEAHRTINIWPGRTRCKATIWGAQSSRLRSDGIFLLWIYHYQCRYQCRWFASAFDVAIIGSHITIPVYCKGMRRIIR